MTVQDQEIENQTLSLDRKSLKVCDDVSGFIMFLVFIACAVIAVLLLRVFNPLPATEIKTDPDVALSSTQFWLIVYLLIALIMAYAWGWKPIKRFLHDEHFEGRRAIIFKKLTKASTPWGILLAISFIATSLLMEGAERVLPETLEQISNLTLMICLYIIWRVLDYFRHIAVRTGLGQVVTKPTPWHGAMKFIQDLKP